jgi:hypothetical protein
MLLISERVASGGGATELNVMRICEISLFTAFAKVKVYLT